MRTIQPAMIEITDDRCQCQGDWAAAGLTALQARLMALAAPASSALMIDGSGVDKLDSAGAWLLTALAQRWTQQGKTVSFSGFNQEQQSLLSLVTEQSAKVNADYVPSKRAWNLNIFYAIGKFTANKSNQALDCIAFIGEVFINIFHALRHPALIQWKALLSVIEEMGYKGLPIIGLLTFLIGVVMTYQMGQQLKVYGANIYIVSMTGVAILQEFAPLMTAIIVAGRTGSAFTAQIGSMKINQEIDALATMGILPINRLILPKIFGLLIVLPLLVLWADIFGVFGSMVMSKNLLDMNYYDFLMRFEKTIELSTFLNGLIKTPVFAIIIATVGCFQGLNVGTSADSLGKQTTKSVVQSIFLIIIADALFSIILSWQSF